MSINSTSIPAKTTTSNLGSEIGTNVAFSGVISGGFGSISAIKNHGGIRKAFKATKENNAVLKEYMGNLPAETDTFTKNIKAAYNYQDYTRLAKKNAKAAKKLAKVTKLPFFEKVKNLFRTEENKLDLEGYKAKLATTQNEFIETTEKLKNGESISDEVLRSQKSKLQKKLNGINDNSKVPLGEKIKNFFRKDSDKIKTIEDYKENLNKKILNASDECLDGAKSILKSTKGLFKSELKDPMGIFFAATETFSRITTEAIPAFQNEGFVSGIKATGKALAAGVATWITDAGFSVAFRTAGATIGSVFGPVGSAIGSLVGNAIGGLMSCKLIQKIFPVKEMPEQLASETTQNMPQELAQNVEENNIQDTTQIPQQTTTKYIANETEQTNLAQDNTIQTQSVDVNSLNNPETRYAAYARINAKRQNASNFNPYLA